MKNLDSISTSNPKQFWEKLNSLGSRNTSKIPDKARKSDGSLTDNLHETLEVWKQEFSTLFNRSDLDNNDTEYRNLLNELHNKEDEISNENYECDDFLNEHILLLELKETIAKLKNGKATGLDQIPNEVIKNDVLLPFLCKFFNICFDSGLQPSSWSNSVISPIPKSSMKDKFVPLQYRGISLMSCVYKLYSTVLNHRLYAFLDVRDWFDDSQNGFRGGRSCEDHVFSLISQLKHCVTKTGDAFCCYIDFQKAFDFLDRDLLFLKLLRAGVDGKFYWALKNSLVNTSSCVRLNGHLSNNFSTAFGTRQGDPVSPTNFSIFINDLLVELRHEKLDSDILVSNVFAYADDLVIISESELDLQRLINIVRSWCNKWRLAVNIDKTKVVHYRKKNTPCTDYMFKWGDNQIGQVNDYKYLGVIIDEYLDFDLHCDAISNSAGRALGRIVSKFSYFRNVGFKTFNKLFESNVESIMSYGISALGSKEYSFEKIQSRAIRYFLGVHPKTPIPALFGEVGWIPFKYKRWISMCRSWNRFLNMDDERINKQIFLQDYSSDISSWCTDFHNICIHLELTDKFENLEPIDLDLFRTRLNSLAAERWRQSVLSKPKLRTYRLFKQELIAEEYVNCLMTRFQRSTFAKFRCGILPLQIEVGRFRGQNERDRICPICRTAVESDTFYV